MTAQTNPAVIDARNLSKHYSVNATIVAALRGVDLRVDRGAYLAISGPSGSGKSTMLQLLGGLDHPSSGTVSLLGTDLTTLTDRDLTRLRLTSIGFVFQRFHLLPVLTAVENVELPMAEAGRSKRERVARARELLGYVGLSHRAEHRATELSGGEMQRVAIARALANEPALILADEPTGELDQTTGSQILDLLDRLHADGATIVVVTHDERLATRAARRVRMLDGQIESDSARG